jgi:glutathione S-transferase
MATGFTELRRLLPMAIGSFTEREAEPPQRAIKDICRIKEIIEGARLAHRHKGPFLFGAFSIADAMFTPVISRFEIYRVPMSSHIKSYSETISDMGCVREWHDNAINDGLEIDAISKIVKSYPNEISAACKI